MQVNCFKTFLKILAKELKKGNFQILENLIFFYRWRTSFQKDEQRILKDLPWITFLSIDFLEKYLNPGLKIFEYGGGSSTNYFCNKGCEVYTIENNRDWFDILKKNAHQKGLQWQGELIEGETIDNFYGLNAADPYHYYTTDESSLNYKFEKYVKSIDKFKDNNFDLVLVDGRSRPSCIMHAIPKIKPGGLLVLDNSERPYYLSITKKLIEKKFTLKINRLGLVPNLTHFSETSIWMKN